MFKQYIRTPGEITSVVNGSIMVTADGTILKGVTINGDLILGDGIGNGKVTADGITVNGRTVIRSGSLETLINLNDSKLGEVVLVNRSSNPPVVGETPGQGPITSGGALQGGSGGSSSGSGSTPGTKEVSVTVDKNNMTLDLYGTKTGKITAEVLESTNKGVTWEVVSGKSHISYVVSGDNDTVFEATGVSVGTTVVRAIAKADTAKKSRDVTITVKDTTPPASDEFRVVHVYPPIPMNDDETRRLIDVELLSSDYIGLEYHDPNSGAVVPLGPAGLPNRFSAFVTTIPGFLADNDASRAEYQKHLVAIPKPLPPTIPDLKTSGSFTAVSDGSGMMDEYLRITLIDIPEIANAADAAKFTVKYFYPGNESGTELIFTAFHSGNGYTMTRVPAYEKSPGLLETDPDWYRGIGNTDYGFIVTAK